MFSTIQSALRWRDDDARTTDSPSDTHRTEGGFSLIEMLVVVIVIGILAAIAIPMYVGIQNNARDAGVKSDLVSAKVYMVAAYTKDGTYPSTIAALKAAGFSPSAATTEGYLVNWQMFNVTDKSFCLRGWADTPGDAADLWITESSGVVGPIAVSDLASRPAGCPK